MISSLIWLARISVLGCSSPASYRTIITQIQQVRTYAEWTARDWKNAVADVSILDGGKRLKAAWTTAKSSTYHSIWLRHNCQCPECRTPSNQNRVLSHELDPHVSIRQANITDGERVQIKWSCSHEGYLNLDWLKKHCYSSQTMEELRRKSTPILPKVNVGQKCFCRDIATLISLLDTINHQQQPHAYNDGNAVTLTIWKISVEWGCLGEHARSLDESVPMMPGKEIKNDLGLLKWLKMLNEYGFCLVTGLPRTVEAGLEMCHKITPNIQKTLYGEHTFIKVLENPITAGYTTTNLEPHMDTPIYESIPGVIFLHCLRNDDCVEGGESTVIDALAVVEKFRVSYPQHFDTLVRVPATFQRISFDVSDNPVHMVYRSPHIHVNGHNQIVKLRWSPHNEGPLIAAEEDVEPYYEAYSCLAKELDRSENKYSFRMQPGDMLTLNNMRMLHGRTDIKLNEGVRLLSNFSINIDDFKSRLMVLCAKYDPHYLPKNLLNNDFSYSTAARCV